MTTQSFEDLALDKRILSALDEAGYQEPTEIQSRAIPEVLNGHDLMATARTGTGKTAAFTLPLLQLMIAKTGIDKKQAAEEQTESDQDSNGRKPGRRIKLLTLILSPTRELAQQIESNLEAYAANLPFKTMSVVGGLPIGKQIRKLQKGVDILVATPGRLLDLMQRRAVRLRDVSFFVLDEADRMLDMGFIHDVQDIARELRKERQTLLFSATASPEIQQLSRTLLKDPKHLSVSPPQSVAENITQKLMFVELKNKRALMLELLSDPDIKSALVFTETKSNANVLASMLSQAGIDADAIHSDKNQRVRQQVLSDFEDGKIKVLVATDVMARGIDVDGITHVFNYELPGDPENFVHRIGRTARAGASGVAISLCDLSEVSNLKSIESFSKIELPVDREHKYHSPFVETMKNQKESPFAKRGRR